MIFESQKRLIIFSWYNSKDGRFFGLLTTFMYKVSCVSQVVILVNKTQTTKVRLDFRK